MSAPSNRRGFLRGLTTLPLVGGGVALIGNPTGVAAEPSTRCLESYLAFLHYEARALHDHLYPGYRLASGGNACVMIDNPGGKFHFRTLDGIQDWPRVGLEAAHRAPVVLSAVGCGWHGRRA